MILIRQLPQVASAVNCVPTIAVCAVMVSLAWIAIVLRFWTKVRIVKTVGWDDWIMLVATIFFTVYCASVIDISTRVTSTHQIVSFNDLLVSVNLLNVAEVFYVLSVMALKIALSLFFLRLAVERWQRRVIFVALAVSSSFSVLMFFFVVFQCGVYDNSTVFLLRRFANHCASNNFTLGMTYTHAVITTLTDWTFLILPVFILNRSLMKKNEKRTVVLILMFASVGGIASIIRFKFIHGLAIPRNEFFANARDIGIWSCLEPGVGIISGSVVTLRPLIRRLVFIFKNSSYSNSRFFRRPSPPIHCRNASSCNSHQPQQRDRDQLPEQHICIVEEKKVETREIWMRPPTAEKKSVSGLPLHLFGSIRSRSSSHRTRSSKSSTSRFSRFSNAPTVPGMPSFIWREITDETEEEGSMRDCERENDKHSESSDLEMRSRSTWLEQDSDRGDPGAAPSPRFGEEEDWLEEQLSLEQLNPNTKDEEPGRRFSQGTGLYSSMSSSSSPRSMPNLARAQSLQWHRRSGSAPPEFFGVPEIPALLSPLFPEGHEWYQTLDLGESRPSSYIPEPESAHIRIGLQIPSAVAVPLTETPHLTLRDSPHTTPRGTPRQSQSHVLHQRKRSENSVMQARIESIPQDPASHYQGRTSEDSLRWPSTPKSAFRKEALGFNQERSPPRKSSRIFPPRGSSRVPLPQENGVRFQPYFAAPGIAPSISPRRFWQQKPLPPPPTTERKALPEESSERSAPPSDPSSPHEPPMPSPSPRVGREEKERSSGLPLDVFLGSSSRASLSSKSSV